MLDKQISSQIQAERLTRDNRALSFRQTVSIVITLLCANILISMAAFQPSV